MYKFSDVSEESEVAGGGGKMSKGGGCYVRATTGIIIALLAIVISVGVGLIVHFAENRALECNFPKVRGGDGSVVQAQAGGKQTISTACPTLAALKTSATPTPSQKTPQVLTDIRLPKTWKPIHYILKITPQMYGNDPSKFTFEGHVKIEMNCTEATSNVTLHLNQLEISSPRFSSSSDSNSPSYQTHTEDKERQFLIIHLDKSTQTGQTYYLEMSFNGPLKDDMKGVYLSSFKQGDKTSFAAVTQFQPTDARKAFPCFDEPQLKATFDIILVRKNHLKSISNMPIANSIPVGNDMVEDHYEVSRKMSTYLLAFVIGDFHYAAANTSKGLLYRAWARADSVDQTHTALDVGVKTIVNYENYFGIDFPLPKQDMIAVPELSFGAMENWGLITYKDRYMLYTPGISPQYSLEGTTVTITHELAHQWFGDLVTMQWWDDLWLNEGFARFVEHLGADFIHPDWKMFEQFVVDVLQDALEFDGFVTSHPIYVPVNNPDEINEIFDTISYSKAASVIRMMRFVLGDETFQKGIQSYLKSHQYQNAFHDDLWQALTEQSINDGHKVAVKEFMDTWILQMNYPVVKVTKQNDKISLRQSRFLSDSDAVDPGKYTSPFGYKWRIPFTYTTSDNLEFTTNSSAVHWLLGETSVISHPGIQTEGWVLGNVQQYGFYRVTYEDDNWMALVAQLKNNHKAIHTINRAQIINDAWNLARARQLSTAIALGTLEYLGSEIEYIPWVAAKAQIDYLDSMLSRTDLYGRFLTFMTTTLANPFKHYGMDDSNSSHIETYIRSDIANMACSYGITECITQSKRIFKQWMDNPSNNKIDPDLRGTVYCTAIAEGGSEEWNFAYNQFKTAKVVSEKVTIIKALACTKSTWLLSRYLSLAIAPAEIRKQDAVDVMVYVSQNPVGQALTWDFVRANWNYLMNTYGNGLIALSKLMSGITTSFNTEFQLTQLTDFLAKNPYMGTGSRAFQQAIEKTRSNIKWMQQNKAVIGNWLQTVNVPKVRVTDVRLPRHLIPRTYDLTIQPNMYGADPENFNFEGHVKIVMEAAGTGSNVTLNAYKLTIDENSIKFGREDGVTGGPVYTGEKTYDSERQFEIFSLDKDVTVGEQYYIEMNFTGPLTGDLTGLYLSQYQRGNETVYLAATQLESTDARKAFPCFDEPEFKAAYNVKLVRKSHLKSLSNMPITGNETLDDDLIVDIFATSPNMSTYLLCLIVCDFEYTEATTTKGVQYRAWSRPEYVNQTNVALNEGVKIIDYYADYFGIDFPLPKEDMFALPDFRAGAMENWGLIVYRETAMLVEDSVSSETNLQRVAEVIAHELAHMWFGDLVTMDWWDDLWLNEGFATFVSYMGRDHIHPDWKMFEQIVLDLYNSVFVDDALVTSHPIYIPVNNPVEIGQIFDAISYEKGSMVIRMMRFILSEQVFQQGVQIYLRNREYSNANHNDLWDGLEQAAKKGGITIDVRGIMDTWILQMNYPVVMMTRSASGKILLQQKRFLSNPNAVDPGKYPSPYNYTWQIPFTYTTKTGADFNVSREDVQWLEDKEQELTVNFPSTGDWIIGNIQQFGIYRVNYEKSNWLELIKQLKSDHKVIHTINRGQIINDAFELSKAEELPMTLALQTVEYLQDEEGYIPWVAASGQLEFIAMMLLESEVYGRFRDFMSTTTQRQFERLGLNDTRIDHLTSLLRSLIANKACGYGNEKCVAEAKQMFDDYMKTKINSIDPGVRGVVYCTAIRAGEEKEWEFLFNEYKRAAVVTEKMRLMSALSCARQPWLLYRMLDLTFQEGVIRKQDAYLVYWAVGNNEVGALIAWNFFRDNWDRIFKEFGGSSLIGRIITGVTSTFNSEFLLQEMKDFRTEHHDMGRGTVAYAHAIENVEANILWMRKNYQTVKEWLEKMYL